MISRDSDERAMIRYKHYCHCRALRCGWNGGEPQYIRQYIKPPVWGWPGEVRDVKVQRRITVERDWVRAYKLGTFPPAEYRETHNDPRLEADSSDFGFRQQGWYSSGQDELRCVPGQVECGPDQ